MENISSKLKFNLYEFAVYMKKCLVWSLILIAGAFIALIAPLAIAALIGLLMFGVLIALIVFRIRQLVRLSRAKNERYDPLIGQSFQLLVGAIIIDFLSSFTISMVSSFIVIPSILSLALSIGTSLMTIWGYYVLVKFTKGHFSSPRKVQDGFRLYSICSFITS